VGNPRKWSENKTNKEHIKFFTGPTIENQTVLARSGWLQQQQCLLGLLFLHAPIAPNYTVPGKGSCRHSDTQVSLGLECVGDIE